MTKTGRLYIITAVSVIVIALISYLIIIFTVYNGEDEVTILPFEEVIPFVRNAVVMFVDESSIIVRGELSETENRPFIQDGMTYVSVNDIALHLGVDFEINQDTKIVTLEYEGAASQFLADFSLVILNGNEPMIMRSKVIERGGVIFLPAVVLAKIINVPYFHDYEQGIMAIYASKPLTREVFDTLQNYAGIERRKPPGNNELDELARKHNISDLYQIAREERLFVADNSGVLYRWVMLDDFSLVKEHLDIDMTYSSDTVYMSGTNAERRYLFVAYDYQSNDEPERISPVPDMQINENLRNTMIRYLEVKAAEGMGASYIYAIDFSGEITGREQNDEQDDEQKSNMWQELCSRARSGDILLFKSFSSDERYGFINHAALILNVSTESNEIHVLHARSASLGVGADLPMDRINFETLHNDDYWLFNDVFILCRVDGMSDETGQKVAEKAYEKFISYEFGFGGFLGLSETTCAEIIRDSLRLENIEIISDIDYIALLKSALDNNERSIVLIPDDIIMSEHISIIYFWQR